MVEGDTAESYIAQVSRRLEQEAEGGLGRRLEKEDWVGGWSRRL